MLSARLYCTVQRLAPHRFAHPHRPFFPPTLACRGARAMYTHAAIVAQSEEIRKPDLDDRSYRHIVLQNGIEALLVSDPTTDLAAAAVDVNVGHFSDPADFPGLAHFLEHMLFMGSETFPDENAYSKYLSENGGHSNAFTSMENTNYFFDVKHDKFKGALDRFAPFFTCPLLSESGTEREMQAVDSENKKNLLSDMWRNFQLAKSTSNAAHPFSKFGTGNLETLGSVPRAKGLDTQKALLDFHRQYYSSNLMRAVLVGREPLDQLAEWTVEKFAAVANKSVPVPTWTGHPYGAEQLGRVIFTKPVRELRYLELAFQLPDLFEHDATKPGNYWSHLIGHESKGSLLSYLKAQGLASSLSSSTHNIGKGSDLLEISIDLTPQGATEWQRVLKALFAYVQVVLRGASGADGVQQWIFDETRALHEVNFKFLQKGQPSSYASGLAGRMQKYGAAAQTVPKLLSGKHLMEKFDAAVLTEVLDLITHANCAVTLVAPEAFDLTFAKGSADVAVPEIKKEQWYGTEYMTQRLPPALVAELDTIGDTFDKAAGFALPKRNEFVPSSLEVKDFVKQEQKQVPALVSKADSHRLFFKKDDFFGQPKANAIFKLLVPTAYASARNAALSAMFVKCVRDSLVEYTYYAELAGLSYSFDSSMDGFQLGIGGFNDKQGVLLEKLVREIRNFKVSEERFQILKEQLERSLRDRRREAPYEHARYYLTQILSERWFTFEEQLEALLAIKSGAELQAFIDTAAFEEVFVEGLIVGNFAEAEARGMMQTVEAQLKAKATLSSTEVKGLRSYKIPPGKRFVYEVDVFDKANVNSAIELFIPTGSDSVQKDRVLISLLAQILSEPCFDTLRTKEQLGYIVSLHYRKQSDQIGLRVLVQSERPALYLEGCIARFLEGSRKFLAEVTDAEFSNYKEAVSAKFSEKDKNMDGETQRYWGAIAAKHYDFNQRFADAAAFAPVTKAEVQSFFETRVLDAARAPKLSVHLKSQIPYKPAAAASPSATGHSTAQMSTLLETLAAKGHAVEEREVWETLAAHSHPLLAMASPKEIVMDPQMVQEVADFVATHRGEAGAAAGGPVEACDEPAKPAAAAAAKSETAEAGSKVDWQARVREQNTFMQQAEMERERSTWQLTEYPKPAIKL